MLYIAEKPELARAIVEALGGGNRKNGYYECGTDTVAWCYGHMLELCEPQDYDPRFRRWNLDDLPLFFTPWKKKPAARAKEQLGIIIALLKGTDTAVNAGDPDAEGQLLVDEILAYAGFKGKVLRVLINDNTPTLVKKAIGSMRDNTDFAGLSAAAEARRVGDALYGFNLTRLYTLVGRREGFTDVLSVGRVQTPILGLVVRRDRENEGHKKVPYYQISGVFRFGDVTITATYRNKPDDPRDDKGRLVDAAHAQAIAAEVSNKLAVVKAVETTRGETPLPLPYNLLKLQADASRVHGMTPDAVKDITQALREKYRLITYNRSDSQYLSDEQHADAPAVIAAIADNALELSLLIDSADPAIKGRAFDSAKVTAHHAIIPTQGRLEGRKLSTDELRIYHLIARAYLIQFQPNQQWERTVITLETADRTFVSNARTVLANGWRDFHEGEEDGGDDEAAVGVPLREGQEGICASAEVVNKETTPKPLYTMAGLLEDLTRVSQYVRDETLRKLLIDKDRGKAGEHGGIGTPATRDTIIKTLFDRGFIETVRKGKVQNVVSTRTGREFYDALPDSAKFPDHTALWHQQQLEIERGELTVDAFVEELVRHIGGECARVMKDGLGLKFDKFPCPACNAAMQRRKGDKGFFWGCANYPSCKTTIPDDNGKPGAKPDKKDRPIASGVHQCLDCGKGLARRRGKKGVFWGCGGYPGCKRTYPDLDGKPNYATAKKIEENKQ